MTFSLNQIFTDTYPPEAAQYCNKNTYCMAELNADEGHRRFQIQEIPPPSDDEFFSRLRSERDARIHAVDWIRERHKDETALGIDTRLTSEQYTALLTYIQALRDIPAQPGAPWDGGGELTPWPELPTIE